MQKKKNKAPPKEGLSKIQVNSMDRITASVARTLMQFDKTELENTIETVEKAHLQQAKTEEEKACIRYAASRIRANRASSFLEPRAGRTKMDICMELMATRGLTWEEACAEWQRGGQ